MNIRRTLRLISLAMFVVAVIFVFCDLSCPTLGHTIYIGNYAFGAEQWRICYAVYVVIMATLFVVSFFAKNKK